ncbi:MAG: hypothetical protein VST67_07760 [Nitrospirota bacterium]|nr:hypothetical protein [Nitrospirota bacterium]
MRNCFAADELSANPFFEALEIFGSADPGSTLQGVEFNGSVVDEYYFT